MVHAVIGRALKVAVGDRLITSNPAVNVEHRPRRSRDRLADRAFQTVIKTAGVKMIIILGCRHTVATLLLQAGVPVQELARRLGHSTITMTLEVYAHSLPNMDRDAASRLGALLSAKS